MLRDIWKRFNVSLVMVLPLFWDISNNIVSRRGNLKFPFPQLALECGLLNTFLLRDGKFDGNLYLLFDKEIFIKNLSLTHSKYFSICELLVDCKYFSSVEVTNDYVVIGLRIPEEYHADIQIILKGAYSTLSAKYKDEIYFRKRMTHIPESNNQFAMYLVSRDLAYGIAIKDIGLREELKDILDYKGTVNEYYPCLKEINENYSKDILTSSRELLKV